MNWYASFGKRTFDLAAGAMLLLAAAPVMLVTLLMVRRFLGSPALFRQERSGLEGRPFVLYKFRSMTYGVDLHGMRLPDDQRLTPFGRWLRATSLDELPQLWNVVRGEMSLVGPRPLLPEYDAQYSVDQRRRLEVRPGVTGWAQVRGRNAVSWSQRLADDVWYVDHVGLVVDLRILASTVVRVLGRSGVSAEGQATMPSFLEEPPSQQRAA